jgi:glutamine cyclotransferase
MTTRLRVHSSSSLALLWLLLPASFSVITFTPGEHFTILDETPHEKDAFTQGLTFDGQRLYESTGRYGESDLRELDPASGEVLKIVTVDNEYFAEGLTLFETATGQKRLIQITWKERTGWIYDADSLQRLQEFRFSTSTNEGWGITYNNRTKEFIVSDGSHWLHIWDRDTLQEKRRIPVVVATAETRTAGGLTLLTSNVKKLNELELIDDRHVLANVWLADTILKVNIYTGVVIQSYDFTSLYPNRAPGADVLNGISVTDKDGEYWITGKLWPTMYRVKLLI